MAVLKCKMCGGNLTLVEGASTAECEYCGSVQTIPKVDDEKKLTLFARANRLRADSEFDKAAGIYETIVADFPEEAEAYWGLVLCKYGIEYVDDPPTGKKVPTCHRTIPTSITEDPDYRETLKKADAMSVGIYRSEAEQIDQIQKKILRIVSNEQPYDVFICYKETDDDTLRRTEDSSDAQDLFTELTKDGYRVFFSRSTLKDVAGGLEYEPYIYAALNSAKAMIAIGSREEYFQAVWVKNEWARFLDMMKNEPGKVLIPCYKNMDPYDLPREFRNLQALNMADLTFYSSLKKNLERVIFKKEGEKTAVPEKTVFGGDSKLDSLLDRGNMALEDGDWSSADGFFEEVLNNDSKNSQAYLGKTLVMEKCGSLDALLCRLKDACRQGKAKQLSLQEDKAHIEAMVQQCAIQNYVDKEKIRALYKMDLSYSSEAESRRRQYQETETWWKNHKWLSRAEKFAAGETAEVLQQARDDLFSALNARIAKAEQAEQEVHDKKLAQYQAHLQQADEAARELFTSGSYARQIDYEVACSEVDESTDIRVLDRAVNTLYGLNGYENSNAKCAEGEKKIEQIIAEQQAEEDAERARRQAEEAAEKERQRKEAEIARKKKERDDSIGAIVILLIMLALVAGIAYAIYHFAWAKPKAKYDTAVMYYETGKYQEAITLFSELKHFKDSEDKLPEVKYAYAEELAAKDDYDGAITVFAELGEYKDSIEKLHAAYYKKGDILLSQGNLAYAAYAFGAAKDYKDASEKKNMLWAQLTTGETMSGNYNCMVCVKTDGTVRISGKGEESYWSDIIAVSRGYDFTVGLKKDGTVVATGENDYGECSVSGWTDIVAISAGSDHTVGIKSDGTVVTTQGSIYDDINTALYEVTQWTDIIAVSAGDDYTAGLKADGTVKVVGEIDFRDVSIAELQKATGWTDIVAISAGTNHLVGLKSDGTAVAVGSNKYGQCDVSDWSNIVAICAGGYHTLGLKADGTVVAVGDSRYGMCKVSDWTNIVALAANSCQSVGLKADGTVVAVGDKYFKNFDEVHEWTNVKVPE